MIKVINWVRYYLLIDEVQIGFSDGQNRNYVIAHYQDLNGLQQNVMLEGSSGNLQSTVVKYQLRTGGIFYDS